MGNDKPEYVNNNLYKLIKAMVRKEEKNRIKWKFIFQIFQEGIDDNIKFKKIEE